MKGRIDWGFIIVIVFGFIVFNSMFSGKLFIFNLNNSSVWDNSTLGLIWQYNKSLDTTAIIPITTQQNTTYTIEMRNGKLLYCKNYKQTDCGLMLSGCQNNAKYNCLNGTVKL